VNLDELQSVRDRERQTDKPQQLRESFYTDVGEFIQQLRAERDRVAERTGDPYAPEAMRLKDEIDAARQLVEDIHERRIGKVVKAASLDAAALSPEVDGLTAEEQELFDALVTDIERHREHVLDIVDGESSGPSESPPGESSDNEPGSASPGESSDHEPGSASPGESPGHEPGNAPAATDRGDAAGKGEVTAADVMGAADEASPDGARTTRVDHPPAGPPDAATEQDSAPASGSDRQDSPAGGSTRDGTGRGSHDQSAAGDTPDTPVRNDGGHDSVPAGEMDDALSEDRETAVSGDPQTHSGGVERERVLVTEDLDTFVGFDDRDYDLAADDVVTLPSTNADLLVERDAARRL